MNQISPEALHLLSELLEDAEETISICSDVEPWCDRKPLVEELWKLYESQLDSLRADQPEY